ncbi:MAG: phage antirepressor KilAC domain-containing protein [Clostridium sp.]|nr:phage antirepressor KilAC domain-containing protein [Clostridium sp.]MCM1459704.1 phage antirepressor KilAC domain-containing protein [Bacteroides sp.]
MNELKMIEVNMETQTISARGLYKLLEIEKRFSTWFKTNSQGFIENEDFRGAYLEVQGNQYGGKQIVQDYEISVDMAKHICLMSRTEKGKQCRQYLIDLEKAWNKPEQVMARALRLADLEIQELKNNNISLLEDNQRMKPKEIFADAVSTSHTSILIGELAKILKQNGIDIGQNRLFAWMRNQGYLISRKGTDYNMPTQRSMEQGLFEIKESTSVNPDGSIRTNKTPKVIGKGQQYFINKFLNK